jgi:primosomal protein N' (replication factor Y)
MFAKVIVDVAHSSVDRIFEYRIPADMMISEGYRVLVPFGHGNKAIEGYTIGITENCGYDERELKEILRPMEMYPALTKGQIHLAEWIRDYYHTALCIALRLMFPAELRGERIREKRDIIVSLISQDHENLMKSFHTLDGRIKAKNKLALFVVLKDKGTVLLREIPEPLRASVTVAIREGWAQKHEIESNRKPYEGVAAANTDFALTPWQQDALEKIKNGVHTDGRFLLHGVTGSGKTEVYIRAIQYALQLGKTAILLVPEISLTPQMVEMFKGRLREEIAVQHSGLTAGQRFDEWRKIRKGHSRVVIGARSAIFAPVENLGIVILDEEHETSYRSDIHPKYQTHEIALKRAQLEHCALVLGSATPSVETYYSAQQGQYVLLNMPKRLFDLELPRVIVADMREEIKKGNRTIFSGILFEAIQNTLHKKKQVMLFINRRGYSTFVMCRGCGYVEYCDNCAVTMTYHSSTEMLKCHYCGRSRPVSNICPECGKPYLKYFGIGTQKVEEETRKLFPQAKVLRMDQDTMQKKEAHIKIYESFKNREADILIGTQMIAKGFDFGSVSLVGVIAADTSLRFPDYRSAERTYQLIEQVSGRAGRKEEGSVVVQTYAADHYAVKFAANHDYTGFYEQEVRIRSQSFLPPFGEFIRFIFSGVDEAAVKSCAEDFRTGLAEEIQEYKERILLFEIGLAPIKRIEGKTRYQILLKILKDSTAKSIHSILYEYTKNKKYTECIFGMEINPLNMI